MTIHDVAKRAEVSVSTVSLTLNHPDRVREATRAKVLHAIHELDFVPKVEAVIRSRRGVGRIGVIAPFSSFTSFAQRLNGVLAVASKAGLDVVIYDQESAAESRLATLPLTRRVDGLIVMSLPFSEQVAGRLVDQGVPTVLIELGRPGFSSVSVDNVAGGRMAAELFVSHGHERFAYIGHAQAIDYVSESRLRSKGFSDALPVDPQVRLVAHSYAAARAASLELLSTRSRPTAVFAYSDLLAGGVLKAARELGMRVPGDVEVIGFDDSQLAESIGLTSVRQPLKESGEIAAELLLARISNPSTSIRTVTLELIMVERESTAGVQAATKTPARST
jgi:LacI family transcriptional regulator